MKFPRRQVLVVLFLAAPGCMSDSGEALSEPLPGNSGSSSLPGSQAPPVKPDSEATPQTDDDAGAFGDIDEGLEADAGSVPENGGPKTYFYLTDLEYGLFDEKLSHWVTLANQVSVFTIVAESPRPNPRAGEPGMFGFRNITIQIERNLWVPKEGNSHVLPVGAQLVYGVLGEVSFEDGSVACVAYKGAPRQELGGTYIAPLVQFGPPDEYDSGWGNIVYESVMPAPGSEIAERDALRHGAGNASTGALRGKNLDEIEEILNGTEPLPGANQCRNVFGLDRWSCISRFNSTPEAPAMPSPDAGPASADTGAP